MVPPGAQAGLASQHGAPQACPGGQSFRERAAGVDQPAKRTDPPGQGHGGRPSAPAGLRLSARAACLDQCVRRDSASGSGAAWLDQPARRDSAYVQGFCEFDQPARLDSSSERVPRTSTIRPGGTQPPVLGSVVGSAVQAGLSLRTRVAGVDQPARRDSSSERGPRRSTRRPGGTSLPARCSTSLPGGTELPGGGRGGRQAGPAGLGLRTRVAGVDQPPQWD